MAQKTLNLDMLLEDKRLLAIPLVCGILGGAAGVGLSFAVMPLAASLLCGFAGAFLGTCILPFLAFSVGVTLLEMKEAVMLEVHEAGGPAKKLQLLVTAPIRHLFNKKAQTKTEQPSQQPTPEKGPTP